MVSVLFAPLVVKASVLISVVVPAFSKSTRINREVPSPVNFTFLSASATIAGLFRSNVVLSPGRYSGAATCPCKVQFFPVPSTVAYAFPW